MSNSIPSTSSSIYANSTFPNDNDPANTNKVASKLLEKIQEIKATNENISSSGTVILHKPESPLLNRLKELRKAKILSKSGTTEISYTESQFDSILIQKNRSYSEKENMTEAKAIEEFQQEMSKCRFSPALACTDDLADGETKTQLREAYQTVMNAWIDMIQAKHEGNLDFAKQIAHSIITAFPQNWEGMSANQKVLHEILTA